MRLGGGRSASLSESLCFEAEEKALRDGEGRTAMKKYIMALDQGTTSSRCILFDKKGAVKSPLSRKTTMSLNS